jgi:RHS repeat-associated protein
MKNAFIAFALLALSLGTPALAGTQPRASTDSEEIQWSSGTYRYDGAGNIVRIGTDVYRYDAASRLVHATADTPRHRNTQTFAYDAFGNLRRIDTTSVRDGAAPNTLATIIGIDPRTNRVSPDPCAGITDGSCLFGNYDEAGNQIWTSAGVQYEYDATGMVVRLRSTTRQEEYVYDANNERIATVGALETRVTLRDLDAKVARELTLRNGTAQWKKDYVYRDGTLLAAILPGARHHFHLDHLGTPRLITDDHGMKVSLHTYWPFGPEAPGSEPDAERMKFTGHERDFGAGPGEDHDYMHARYYNPMGGRFFSIDPGKDWNPKQPQSWNLYAYVRNNPLNLTDPTGRSVVGKIVKLGTKGFKVVRKGLTREELVKAVRNGFDVLAKSRKEAHDIAKLAGDGRAPIHNAAHGAVEEGFRAHYHVAGRPTGVGHIFYNLAAGLTLSHYAEGQGTVAEGAAAIVDLFNPLSTPQDVIEITDEIASVIEGDDLPPEPDPKKKKEEKEKEKDLPKRE